MNRFVRHAATAIATGVLSCGPTLTVRHEVEPIHVTVDVYVRVQRELEEFFQFEETVDESDSPTETGNEYQEERS